MIYLLFLPAVAAGLLAAYFEYRNSVLARSEAEAREAETMLWLMQEVGKEIAEKEAQVVEMQLKQEYDTVACPRCQSEIKAYLPVPRNGVTTTCQSCLSFVYLDAVRGAVNARLVVETKFGKMAVSREILGLAGLTAEDCATTHNGVTAMLRGIDGSKIPPIQPTNCDGTPYTLQQQLTDAIEREDYETAARLRDEISGAKE